MIPGPCLPGRYRAARLAGAAAAAVLACAACLNPALEPQPLTITLTVDASHAAVGQEIRFRYDSRGTSLSETVVEYGNGELEAIPYYYTGSAPVNIASQAGHLDYAYDEPGTYTARATVTTVVGTSEFAEVTVHITGP